MLTSTSFQYWFFTLHSQHPNSIHVINPYILKLRWMVVFNPTWYSDTPLIEMHLNNHLDCKWSKNMAVFTLFYHFDTRYKLCWMHLVMFSKASFYFSACWQSWRVKSMIKDILMRCMTMKHLKMTKELLNLECEVKFYEP